MLALLEGIKSVSSAALTVRAQNLSPTNNGTLIYQDVMPREDVDSTKISELIDTDFRPVGARRDWNGSGQRLTFKTPGKLDLSFTPVESDTLIDEQELDELDRTYDGNEALILEKLKVRIPARANSLVEMNYRKINADVHDAWLKGTVTQKDPQSNKTFVLSYGIPVGRIQVAGTAWNTTNAYTNFISWLKDGRSAMLGGIRGAMASSHVIETIIDSAPLLANGMRMNIDEFNRDVQSRVGFAFQFIANDEEADFYTNGGKTTVRQRYFGATKLALIPSDNRVGKTAFAPVRRARALATAVPEAKIDIRGVSVFSFPKNNNKELQIEAQVNAFPVPNENKIWVIDTQIA